MLQRRKCWLPALFPFPSMFSKGFLIRVTEFKNTVGKGEIAHNEQLLLFPQCFQPVWKTFRYFHQTQNCSLQTLPAWKSLKFVIWERVKAFTNKEWNWPKMIAFFLESAEKLWETRKMLFTRMFSIFPRCFLKAVFLWSFSNWGPFIKESSKRET